MVVAPLDFIQSCLACVEWIEKGYTESLRSSLENNQRLFDVFADWVICKSSIGRLHTFEAFENGNKKWHGSLHKIVEAPIDKVWNIISQTNRLPEWMPMVERCTDLAGEQNIPGYTRLVSGYMFPQEDGDRSWIKERLVSMDTSSYTYVYEMEASNVGLDGSVNTLKLLDYGDDSTLVDWAFEICPVEGGCEDILIDYLEFLYKSCINRIEGAILSPYKVNREVEVIEHLHMHNPEPFFSRRL